MIVVDAKVVTEELRDIIVECWKLQDRLNAKDSDFIESMLYQDMISLKQYNWLSSVYGKLFKMKLSDTIQFI